MGPMLYLVIIHTQSIQLFKLYLERLSSLSSMHLREGEGVHIYELLVYCTVTFHRIATSKGR